MSLDPYTILETRIRQGDYPPGSRLPAERQLADELGIHRNTVRRVVARLAEAGWLDCQPGCRPVVRSPGGVVAMHTIALLMGNEPVFHAFQHLLRGCEQKLRASGYRLVYMDTRGPGEEPARSREQQALENLSERPVAGLILWCEEPYRARPHLDRLSGQGTAVVTVDRHVPGFTSDWVGADNIHGAITAVEHLLELGHRRIGFAAQHTPPTSVQERLEGYAEALHSHGLDVDEGLLFWFPREGTEAAVADWAVRLLQTPEHPTAFFAENDIMAWQMLRALNGAGIKVPQDISLVGFDDMEAQAVQTPVMTTVRQPYQAMGWQAARLVLERIRHPDAPYREVLLGTALVRRSSTGPPPRSASFSHAISQPWPVTGSAKVVADQ